MKRQAPRKEEIYWTGAFFFGAWGNGPVRQLRQRSLGAPGLHLRPRPAPAVGSTAGVVVAGAGSIMPVGAAGAG